ncbi:MAG: hypothetical protein WHU10_13780 [Fimbriimonadales bacterium]
MNDLRCLTECDGYDPFAETGSSARSPEALLARLRNLGCEVEVDGRGRPRVTGAASLPSWLKDSLREDLLQVASLLKPSAA